MILYLAATGNIHVSYKRNNFVNKFFFNAVWPCFSKYIPRIGAKRSSHLSSQMLDESRKSAEQTAAAGKLEDHRSWTRQAAWGSSGCEKAGPYQGTRNATVYGRRRV